MRHRLAPRQARHRAVQQQRQQPRLLAARDGRNDRGVPLPVQQLREEAEAGQHFDAQQPLKSN